jgi:UPF0755 protein
MHYRRKRKRQRALRKFLLYIIIIGAIFFGTKYYYTSQMLEPIDLNDEGNVSFEIASGESLTEVSKSLKERELIKSSSVFKSYLKRHKLDKNVKAGNFILQRSMSSKEIAEKITSDDVTETAVTIQEGLTIDQIDIKLSNSGLIEAGELIDFDIKNLSEEELESIPEVFLEILQQNNSNLEGLLFPDTYFISPATFSLNKFVTRLLTTMDQKIDEDMRKTYEMDGKTLYEVLNMASIIEREVRTADDLPIVSGILWKRYNSGWPLGADATILYVTDDQIIDVEELDLDSAYNTRKFLGLPPTPISSPGLPSIKAAIYPEESNYWFYLTTLDTGEVIYAHSNEDHNMNKAKYLR